MADIVVEGGEETVRMIKGSGGEATFVKCDVSKAADVEALVKAAVDTYGRLACANNIAGIKGLMAPTADYAETDWDKVIGINLKGVWLSVKYEIPQIRSARPLDARRL